MANTVVLHFAAIQPYIVSGTGNLDIAVTNRNETRTFSPNSINMDTINPDQAPFKRVNFNAQKAKVRLSIDSQDEQFEITAITVWVKAIWTAIYNV